MKGWKKDKDKKKYFFINLIIRVTENNFKKYRLCAIYSYADLISIPNSQKQGA